MCTSSRRAALNANAARYGGDPRPIIVGCRPLQRTPSPVILVPGTAAWGGFVLTHRGENLVPRAYARARLRFTSPTAFVFKA